MFTNELVDVCLEYPDAQLRQPCAVIVCRTRKEAAAVVRLHSMDAYAIETLMLEETYRQQNACDGGWKPGLPDRVRGYLSALGLAKEGKGL